MWTWDTSEQIKEFNSRIIIKVTLIRLLIICNITNIKIGIYVVNLCYIINTPDRLWSIVLAQLPQLLLQAPVISMNSNGICKKCITCRRTRRQEIHIPSSDLAPRPRASAKWECPPSPFSLLDPSRPIPLGIHDSCYRDQSWAMS